MVRRVLEFRVLLFEYGRLGAVGGVRRALACHMALLAATGTPLFSGTAAVRRP